MSTRKDEGSQIQFERKFFGYDFHWENLPLSNLHVKSDGNIEINGRGMLQADFANKLVGRSA